MVDCSEQTTLDDFANSILGEQNKTDRTPSPTKTRNDGSYFLQTPAFKSVSRSPLTDNSYNNNDNRKIANIIIAKNLDHAPKQVQIQALELIRTRRIFTRTSVQAAPKRFLFIALLAGGEGPRLTKHLNDHIFISHFHDLEDRFANLEESLDDGKSISSVVRRPEREEELEVSLDPFFSATVCISCIHNFSSLLTDIGNRWFNQPH